MSSGRLKGLAAIVTGVAGGVGGAVARRFRNEGARVVGVDNRDPEGMALDGFVVCDVGVSGAVDKAMATALALLGGELDILVTAAARTGGRGRFPDVTDAEWQSYIDVNLGGTFFVCRAAAKVMIARARGGSIVTVGSVNSMAAEMDASPYVASKGGVAMLTKAMAVDLAAHKIRVNMIAPGPVEVPRNSELFASKAFRKGFAETVPLGVVGQPDDIANAAVFLAEDASRMVTGTTLIVDGGLLARIPVFSRED